MVEERRAGCVLGRAEVEKLKSSTRRESFRPELFIHD